jgi:hypothetical protein
LDIEVNFFNLKMVGKGMKFIFVCPTQNKVFESTKFSVLENRGVITDVKGNKTLDAKVALNQPCPFCGQKHVYHASELSCPFESPLKEKNLTKENTHGGS